MGKEDKVETGKIINRISNRLQRCSRSIQNAVGIGQAQANVLKFILVESPLRAIYQKDIEKEFGLRPPTVTEMLNVLEKKEYIKRVPDENDGRRKKIMFTDKAVAIKDVLRSQVETSEQVLLQNITPEEHQQFMKIAQKMLANLEHYKY